MKRIIISMLVVLLLTSFSSISKSEEKEKSLHDAVVTDDIDQIQSLLSKGADINQKNRMNWTPLHTAIQNRKQEIAKLLIEKGADLKAITNRSQTPLHVAVNTDQKEIVELLIAKGVDVNVMAGGDNALTLAQKRKNQEIIDILLKNGAKEPSPQDLMGDRYYPGADPYGAYQQTSTTSRRSRGYSPVNQPVEVDILADPNEIIARIKTFAGLQKELDAVDANSQNEMRQWLQSRRDNRTMLLRYVQKQFEDEFDLIKKVAVSEKAQKTTAAIDSALALRQDRFKAVSKELMVQRREQLEAEQATGRTRGRTSLRSSRGYGSQSEQQYDSYESYGRGASVQQPYGRGRGSTTTRPSIYPGTTTRPTEPQQEIQPVDIEAENETRQWLQTNFDDKTELAGVVNDQIQAEVVSIRDIAVEEKAKKTTAAIDGVLLARKMRLDDFLIKWEEEQQKELLRQQALDSRTGGRYQQNSTYNRGQTTRGGSTSGYQQGNQRTRRRR